MNVSNVNVSAAGMEMGNTPDSHTPAAINIKLTSQ